MRFRQLGVGLVAGALTVFIQGAALVPAKAEPAASVAWAQKDLQISAHLGTVADAEVEITYSGQITDSNVKVSGALASAVTVDLNKARPTAAGRAVVPLHVEMPVTPQDNYNANIQLTVGGKPVPQPLHLNVTPKVIDPNIIPEDIGYPSASRMGTTEGGTPVIVDQMVVYIDPDDPAPDQTIKSVASSISGQIGGSIAELRRYEIHVPGATAETLVPLINDVQNVPGVETATLDILARTSAYTDDAIWQPSSSSNPDQTWNLEQINAPTAWDLSSGKNVEVAVIDSGLDRIHSDLSGNLKNHTEVTGSLNAHGTHTSGTACAQGDNGMGITGVAWECNLSMYGVYSNPHKDGYIRTSDLYRQIKRINNLPPTDKSGTASITTPAPRAVNISLGIETGFDCTNSYDATANAADVWAMKRERSAIIPLLKERQDILWVFAAGNSGNDSSCSSFGDLGNMSDLTNVVTVAATERSGQMPAYSVRGAGVTVAAPGGSTGDGEIYSTLPSNQYGYMQGTSMAAPHVTGTAALAFAANHDLEPADVKTCLIDGAVSGGKNIAGQGYSIINARKTVDCALSKLNQQQGTLTNVQTIVPGGTATYALKKDGTVWGWGNSYYGLGAGSNEGSTTPVQVSGLSGVSAVAADQGHAFALKTDGTLWGWGYNGAGALGNGTLTDAYAPVQVPGLPPVVSVAVRSGSVYAVGNDGSVWAWGNNFLGVLGNGTETNALSPVKIPVPEFATTVYTGGYTAYVLTDTGSVWSWGDNGQGQLGNGTTTASKTPVQVAGLSGAKSLVTTRGSVVYALMPDKTLKVWGEGSGGALGNGTYVYSSVPIDVPNVAPVSQVAAAPGYTFARQVSGTVLAWGNGWSGALGTGNTDSTATPTPVSGISNAVSVATGGFWSMALLADGTVRSWGVGYRGTIGNGTFTTSNPTPVTVSGLSGVVSLVANQHTDTAYAVKADGSVWSWGSSPLGREAVDSVSAATPAPI